MRRTLIIWAGALLMVATPAAAQRGMSSGNALTERPSSPPSWNMTAADKDRLQSRPSFLIASGAAWSAVPTLDEMAAAFPARAIGHATTAHVNMICAITTDGRLTQCDVQSEEPRGMGFAAAARDLSKRFRLIDDPAYVKKARGFPVFVPVDFHDPRGARQAPEIPNPTWLQAPDPATAAQLFPQEAAKAGLKTGRALVDCRAAHDGSLTGCAASQEDPAGLGFGRAALGVTGLMKMNLWAPQGAPVDGAAIRMYIRVNTPETADAAPAGKAAAPSVAAPR